MMMDLFSLNFILTEDCNFNCAYCYQKRGTAVLDIETADKAVDWFFPFFNEKCHVNFSGGEPLLAFETIARVVDHIQEKSRTFGKQIQYSITTNGILLDVRILEFLNLNQFSLNLSFDGLAQDQFREKDSFKPLMVLLKEINNCPDIQLQTNSLFTPESVGYLSESIQLLLDLDIPNIQFSLSLTQSWDSSSILKLKNELVTLKRVVVDICEKTGTLPLTNFRKDSLKGGFICLAGVDRMSLMPDGRLWGCHLFADYSRASDRTGEFQKYCFGDLDSFIHNFDSIYPEIRSRYSVLNHTLYHTPDGGCLQCMEFKECSICPLETVFSGSPIGRIPGYVCRIKKLLRNEKNEFWKALEY